MGEGDPVDVWPGSFESTVMLVEDEKVTPSVSMIDDEDEGSSLTVDVFFLSTERGRGTLIERDETPRVCLMSSRRQELEIITELS
jgi:hypothetical protein